MNRHAQGASATRGTGTTSSIAYGEGTRTGASRPAVDGCGESITEGRSGCRPVVKFRTEVKVYKTELRCPCGNEPRIRATLTSNPPIYEYECTCGNIIRSRNSYPEIEYVPCSEGVSRDADAYVHGNRQAAALSGQGTSNGFSAAISKSL